MSGRTRASLPTLCPPSRTVSSAFEPPLLASLTFQAVPAARQKLAHLGASDDPVRLTASLDEHAVIEPAIDALSGANNARARCPPNRDRRARVRSRSVRRSRRMRAAGSARSQRQWSCGHSRFYEFCSWFLSCTIDRCLAGCAAKVFRLLRHRPHLRLQIFLLQRQHFLHVLGTDQLLGEFERIGDVLLGKLSPCGRHPWRGTGARGLGFRR